MGSCYSSTDCVGNHPKKHRCPVGGGEHLECLAAYCSSPREDIVGLDTDREALLLF